MTLSAHILAFCAKLGLPRSDVINAETAFAYLLTADVAGADVVRLGPTDYQKLIDVFGSALTLRLGLPDAAPLLEVCDGKINNLNGAVAKVQRFGANLNLRVELKLNKVDMLSQYGLGRTDVNGLIFIFSDNLARLLQSSLFSLDKNLFRDAYSPTLVIALDGLTSCHGPLLIIAGPNDLEDLRQHPPTLAKKHKDRVDHYRTTRTNSLNWADVDIHQITPLHFFLDSCESEVDRLDSLLQSHLLKLCVLYTANRTVRNGDDFTSYFANSERSAPVTLRHDASVPLPSKGLLARFATWPYGGQDTDRLEILQNAFARELDKENGNENLFTITKELGRLLDESRWHYRVFVDSKIEKHFEQVQAFARYIVEVTKEVSSSLDVVTKSLVDTLLATVGLIILTLLAALVDNNTRGLIFTVAMRAYAAYLVIFQVFYRLGSILHSYRLQKLETQEQITLYSRLLTQKRVEILTAPLERRRKQFIRWFLATVVIYCVIAALIWYLAGILPSRLERDGIWSAPVVTPTTVPVQVTPTANPSVSP